MADIQRVWNDPVDLDDDPAFWQLDAALAYISITCIAYDSSPLYSPRWIAFHQYRRCKNKVDDSLLDRILRIFGPNFVLKKKVLTYCRSKYLCLPDGSNLERQPRKRHLRNVNDGEEWHTSATKQRKFRLEQKKQQNIWERLFPCSSSQNLGYWRKDQVSAWLTMLFSKGQRKKVELTSRGEFVHWADSRKEAVSWT